MIVVVDASVLVAALLRARGHALFAHPTSGASSPKSSGTKPSTSWRSALP